MALSEKQLLLLDCFMYSDLAPNNCGQSMQDIIKGFQDPNTGAITAATIEKKGVQLSGDLPDHPEDLAEILTEISRDEKLMSLKITHTTEEYTGSIRGACFVEKDGSATVAFRGTGGSFRQWGNNFEGFGDVAQQSQIDAAAFINSLPYTDIDVTGHSNGGNQAMYVAIVCADKVKRCVSYEGQGMSKEFVSAYADEIARYSGNITNYSAEKDFVSPILVPIAGKHKQKYLKSDSKVFFGWLSHGSWGIYKANKNKFDENGDFREDAYVEQAWFCSRIQKLTVLLDKASDTPVVGTYLEVTADILGVIVGGGISHDWSEAFADVAKSLQEYAFGLGRDIETIVKEGNAAVKYIIEMSNDWFSKSFTRRIEAHYPALVVDTRKLQKYAQELRKINTRIVKLDKRLDNLYQRVGLLELWNLMQADLLSTYSLRLRSCERYLNETAYEFDSVESSLIRSI